MNRLTDINKCIVNYKQSYTDEEISNIIVKLGKLEDLEDELGCPLEVVFEALKQGIYSTQYRNCEQEIDDVKLVEPSLVVIDNEFCFDCGDGGYYNVALKDYQKTWWLRGC